MTREKRNKIKAIAGSIIVHIAILVALIFLGLSTPLPLPGEEGVEVNLGSSDVGMGNIQEESPAPSTPPPSRPQPAEPQEEVVKEEVITQEVEEAPAIVEEENPKEKKPEEKKPVEQEKPRDPEVVEEKPVEQEAPVEEPSEPEQKVDPRAMFTGKTNTGTGSNEGVTGQPGDQGKPNGDPGAGNYDGQGGAGNGVSFSLGGRGSRHLPKPSYQSQEQGKVVVDIWVNREGKVVKALAGGKGTTILDTRLRRLAEEAALRSLFEPDPNAPDNQKGTITYNFIRLN